MRTYPMIRKSLTTVLLATGLLAGVSSCKKEESAGPVNPPAVERIKEFKNGDEYVRFQYNTAGDVSKVIINSELNTGGAEETYTVNYDAAKKVVSLDATTGEKIVPVYENNLLKRADIMIADERVGFTNYHYEGNNLKRVTIYFGADNQFQPFLEFNFTHDAAGNITETVSFLASGQPGHMERSGHVTCQYDQKTNPLYVHRDLLALFWQASGKNNVVVEQHFDSNLQLEDKFTYNYTYNGKGLPASAVVTQGLPGQPPVTSNLQFLYQ